MSIRKGRGRCKRMAERVGFEPECAHNLLNHKALGANE